MKRPPPPVCRACGSEMAFDSVQCCRRPLAVWHCAKGHQNRFAYTRFIPWRYSVKWLYRPAGQPTPVRVYALFFSLDESRVYADMLKRDGQFTRVEIRDLVEKRCIPHRMSS